MRIRLISETPIRIDDKPIQPGDVVEFPSEIAKALIDGGRFEAAEPKPKRKKKQDETQSEES